MTKKAPTPIPPKGQVVMDVVVRGARHGFNVTVSVRAIGGLAAAKSRQDRVRVALLAVVNDLKYMGSTTAEVLDMVQTAPWIIRTEGIE